MSLAFDEYGRPFLIIKEQEKKKRLNGVDAIKSSISAGKAIADFIKTSFGPKGFDKILVDCDGEVNITNDGATILKEMNFESEIARLFLEASQAQDRNIGDGTTGVVILAGSLLHELIVLLDKGVHSSRIAEGLELASEHLLTCIEAISEKFKDNASRDKLLLKIAQTSMGSKCIAKNALAFAEKVVDAVVYLSNEQAKPVNFGMIKILGVEGGELSDSVMIKGLVLDKEFSHFQMPKTMEKKKVAILTCPLEPPKLKTKHKLDLTDVEGFNSLKKYEESVFSKMMQKLKELDVSLVLCQWGFDDEANHLLLINGINAIRWVSGADIELASMLTGAKIVPRFEDLDADKVGYITKAHEYSTNNQSRKFIKLQNDSSAPLVTFTLNGGNKMLVKEAERSILDALHSVDCAMRSDGFVYGGGSCEIFCSSRLREMATLLDNEDQSTFIAFANALEALPIALATNAGLNPVQALAFAKFQQKQNEHYFGIDCLGISASMTFFLNFRHERFKCY